ncbi:MAG: hypothetical protein DRJ97_02570 [Thermoprotei archaeon]|nr:MAG: hypothetical protein DRJ97_02570 [Thermoprotei archaeon]
MGSGDRIRQVKDRFRQGEEQEISSHVEEEVFRVGPYRITRQGESYVLYEDSRKIGEYKELVIDNGNRALLDMGRGMILEVRASGYRPLYSIDRAYLHGLLCANGSARKEVGRYRVQLHNGSDAYQEFIRVIREIFGVKISTRYRGDKGKGHYTEFTVYGRDILEDLLKYGAEIGRRNWRPPIEYLDEKGKCAWLQGYFDGDGGVSSYQKRRHTYATIYAKSVNVKGLMMVRDMLEELGIKAKLYGPLRSRGEFGESLEYELRINSIDSIMKFYEKIGFRSPSKARKLRDIIERMRRERFEQ